MSDTPLRVTQEGAVRTLTLNRPEALNSLNTPLLEGLLGALQRAGSDAAVRCIVITGEGRAFCAGQDLSDPLVAPDATPDATPKDLAELLERHYAPLVERLRTMPVPTLASVNGVAAGAGASLALNCDLVLAARSARFIQAFVKIGLLPDSGATWLLPRLVGRGRALGLAMLGDALQADEAERIGLIWRSVDDGALTEKTQALAHRLAALPTRALVATRAAIDAAQGLSLTEAVAAEARLQSVLGAAHDFSEGLAAFAGRRPPVFRDR